MDSAERVFARDGLKGARTEDIAAGSGVTKAMIHYYFDTKEALYQAVLDRVFERRREGLDLDSLASLEPRVAFEAFVVRLLGQMREKPHLGALFALENIQNGGRYYTQSGGRLYRALTELLARGIESGCFKQGSPAHMAALVIGSCVHFFNVSSNLQTLWPEDEVNENQVIARHCDEALKFVLDAVLPHAGAKRSTVRQAAVQDAARPAAKKAPKAPVRSATARPKGARRPATAR